MGNHTLKKTCSRLNPALHKRQKQPLVPWAATPIRAERRTPCRISVPSVPGLGTFSLVPGPRPGAQDHRTRPAQPCIPLCTILGMIRVWYTRNRYGTEYGTRRRRVGTVRLILRLGPYSTVLRPVPYRDGSAPSTKDTSKKHIPRAGHCRFFWLFSKCTGICLLLTAMRLCWMQPQSYGSFCRAIAEEKLYP